MFPNGRGEINFAAWLILAAMASMPLCKSRHPELPSRNRLSYKFRSHGVVAGNEFNLAVGIQSKPRRIAEAFGDGEASPHPPAMTTAQVCQLLQVSRSTLAQWKAEQRQKDTHRRVGGPTRWWRDRVIDRYFNAKREDQHDWKQFRQGGRSRDDLPAR